MLQQVRQTRFTRHLVLSHNVWATELHQLGSPETAHAFLDSLFDSSTAVASAMTESQLFSQYIVKSWAGILKSSGAFDVI